MDRIYPTIMAAHARREDVTPREAIVYMVSKYGALRPTALLDELCDRFVPPFKQSEVKDTFLKMLDNGELILSPDRFLRFAFEKEESK